MTTLNRGFASLTAQSHSHVGKRLTLCAMKIPTKIDSNATQNDSTRGRLLHLQGVGMNAVISRNLLYAVRAAPSTGATLAFVLGSALACSKGEAPPSLTAEVSDSAGVTIVDNKDPLWDDASRWTVDPKPRLQIGNVDGSTDYQFGQISAITRLSNGNIVVADQLTQQISVFDSAGALIRKSGGKGKGPGEFTGLFRIVPMAADSFLAWDSSQNRGTIYDSSGLRARDLTPTIRESRYNRPTFSRALQDGGFVASVQSAPPLESVGYTPRRGGYWLGLAVFDSKGVLKDTIGEFAISRCPGIEQECSRGIFAPTGYAFADQQRAYYGFSDVFDIAVFNLEGRMIKRIRRRVEPVEITNKFRDSIHAATIERADPRIRQRLRRTLSNQPRDTIMPLFRSIATDADGNLWVGTIGAPYQMGPITAADLRMNFQPPRRIFSVFDSSGVYLGDIETPAAFRVQEIGVDYIIGVLFDELDVQYVQMYRLRKPRLRD